MAFEFGLGLASWLKKINPTHGAGWRGATKQKKKTKKMIKIDLDQAEGLMDFTLAMPTPTESATKAPHWIFALTVSLVTLFSQCFYRKKLRREGILRCSGRQRGHHGYDSCEIVEAILRAYVFNSRAEC